MVNSSAQVLQDLIDLALAELTGRGLEAHLGEVANALRTWWADNPDADRGKETVLEMIRRVEQGLQPMSGDLPATAMSPDELIARLAEALRTLEPTGHHETEAGAGEQPVVEIPKPKPIPARTALELLDKSMTNAKGYLLQQILDLAWNAGLTPTSELRDDVIRFLNTKQGWDRIVPSTDPDVKGFIEREKAKAVESEANAGDLGS